MTRLILGRSNVSICSHRLFLKVASGSRRLVVLVYVAPEIIEDTNKVAIKIGGHKFAQVPRFVLGLGNDLRLRGLPLCEEIVHLSLAVEIEPEYDTGL